jgi:hypothetical protein
MANLPSAQAATGRITLCFHDCRAEFSANLDSSDIKCVSVEGLNHSLRFLYQSGGHHNGA